MIEVLTKRRAASDIAANIRVSVPSRKIARKLTEAPHPMAAAYESDITRFLRELKQENPELDRQQREGRAIWWDRDVDRDLYRRFSESTLPQPAYVYQSRAR